MQNDTANYTESTSTTTTEVTPILHPVLKPDLQYLIVPLVVLVVILIVSALVCLMARRKRLVLQRENLLHLYEFDSNENDWETPLLSSDENYGSYNDYGTTVL